MGRPSLYTAELVAEIAEELANGDPLEELCRQRPHWPAARTIRDWDLHKPEVSAVIAPAREAGEYAIAARIRQTARGKTVDDGGDSSGDVQRDKLIIDSDFKLLAKFNPKRWGDKLELAGDKDRPLTVEVVQFSRG